MEILNYFAKVSLYWTLFYLCYQLLLRQNTFFQWNRVYLIGALFVSLILPLTTYPESAPDIPVLYKATAEATTIYYHPKSVTPTFSWKELLTMIYISGSLITLTIFTQKIKRLLSFFRTNAVFELENCTLVPIDTDQVGSFSFFKWIVVNKSDYENSLDLILRHEMVHIQQLHSLDIILVELLKVVFWFNPILILYKRSLQEIHEFLADEQAPDKGNYAQFLLTYALNAPSVTLTNHFYSSSQIKNRIRMIYKNRSAKRLRWYYLASAFMLIMVSILVAGCERFKKKAKVEQLQTDMTIEGHVINADTKRALAGADIVVMNMQRGTTTNADGIFIIDAPGTARLEISFPGFETQVRELDRIAKHLIALRPTNLTDSVAVEIQKRRTDETARMPNAYQSGSNETEMPGPKMESYPETIFTAVQEQPVFPGGPERMFEYLNENIVYPKPAARAGISGRVFVSFVVSKFGRISDITILKGIGFGCDQEAARVVSTFPNWEPGRQNGSPVSVRYNLPILFMINTDDPAAKNTTSLNSQSQEVLYQQSDPRLRIQKADKQLKSDSAKDPLIVVDGKIDESPDFWSNRAPESIASLTVLNGKSAGEKYGRKDKDGVVLVQTKKP